MVKPIVTLIAALTLLCAAAPLHATTVLDEDALVDITLPQQIKTEPKTSQEPWIPASWMPAVTYALVTVASIITIHKFYSDFQSYRSAPEPANCAICLEAMTVVVAKFACGHTLHPACADDYLASLMKPAYEFGAHFSMFLTVMKAMPATEFRQPMELHIGGYAMAILMRFGEEPARIFLENLVRGTWAGLSLTCPVCRAPLTPLRRT